MNVDIQLKTTIDDDGQTEQHTVKETGRFHQKGHTGILVFDEITDDGTIHNFMTMQDGKVSIKRTGAVTMHQQFHLQQKTENVYHHPHGTIHMETYTSDIRYHPNAGELTIVYTVKLNGGHERNHRLNLLFTEEREQ